MPLEDHVYMKLCAELASCLSVSLASARRQVELVAARDGVKDLNERKLIAQRLLDEARTCKNMSKQASVTYRPPKRMRRSLAILGKFPGIWDQFKS